MMSYLFMFLAELAAYSNIFSDYLRNTSANLSSCFSLMQILPKAWLMSYTTVPTNFSGIEEYLTSIIHQVVQFQLPDADFLT
jgi:hypothetical protein